MGANEGVEPADSVAEGDQYDQWGRAFSAASEVGHLRLGQSPAMLCPALGAHPEGHASNDAVNIDTDTDADVVQELRKVLPNLSPALIRRVVMRPAQAHNDAVDDQPVDEREADSDPDGGGDSGGEAAEADVDLSDRIPQSRSCEDWQSRYCEDWRTGEPGPPWAHNGDEGPPWAQGRVHPLIQALSKVVGSAWP